MRVLLLLICGLVGCRCEQPAGPATAPDPGPLRTGATRILAEDLRLPQGIAVDEQNVYFVSAADGDVFRLPKQGGAPTKLASTGFTMTRYVAVGGGFVYYGHPGEGAIYRVAAAGGAAERVASAGVQSSMVRGHRLAADATHLYYASHGLFRLRHDRTEEPASWPVEPIGADQMAMGLANVCAIRGGVLRCADKERGVIRVLAQGFDPEQVEIAVGRSRVFACDYAGEVLLAVPLAGGPPEPVARCHLGTKLLADGDLLYAVEIGGTLHRFTPGRDVDEVLTHDALTGINRTNVWLAMDDEALFASVDMTRFTTFHVDLTRPLAEDPTIYQGRIARFPLHGPVESSRPAERTVFVAWIEGEGEDALSRVEQRLLVMPDAVRRAVREGRVALRLVCSDPERGQQTIERLRHRLAGTWGPALRVVAELDRPPRGGATTVEVIVDAGELASAFAPLADAAEQVQPP